MSLNKNHPLQKINKTAQSSWMEKLEAVTGKPISSKKLNNHSVYFLIDCSGSMDTDDKFTNTKKGAIAYAQEAVNKAFNIGIISFGSTANKVLNAQKNLEEFKKIVLNLQIEGSTNLTDAIRIARESLVDSVGERIIFIVTDGFPDDASSVVEEAKAASLSGIDIMTLGTDDADLEFLKLISTKNEFSIKVDKKDLQKGIASMAKLLPYKSSS